jgi:signal transduction histidine kinase
MLLRRRSVRLRVILLVLVPLAFLAGFVSYNITKSVSSAETLIRSRVLLTDIGQPVASLQQALSGERAETIVYYAQPTPAVAADLKADQAATDRAIASFRSAANSSSVQHNASPAGKKALAGLETGLAGLPQLRLGIAGHSVGGQLAFGDYNNMIAASYSVLEQAIIQEGNSTEELPKIAVVELAISNEYLLQESALLNGDFAVGAFPASSYQDFVSLVGAHRLLYAQSYSYLVPADRDGLNHDVSPQAARTVAALENRLVGGGPRKGAPAVAVQTWNRAVGTVSTQTQFAVGQALARLVAGARSQASATLRGLYLTGGIGLAAVILSLILSVWIAVSLARKLRRLRDSALEMANVSLPALVGRLRAGEDVEVAVQVAPLDAGADEIGQVRAAFNAAQQTAVEAAVDQARMRRGISDVFRNLARRSQSLLARQMMLLDTLERRAAGPEDLESLFRIDHLTTRMRRHAESLIVLAGDLPERTFIDPVPMVDVLRAAASEVEDYTRVKVAVRSAGSLVGPAVSDTIHMLAELLENATSFSPPTTEVRVTGNLVARGYAVDIEDRGLGMTVAEVSRANANLAQPPAFDLSGSDRLGLVVAAQLAHRHGIRVTLRESPYGGMTAIVLIPADLVVPADTIANPGALAARGAAHDDAFPGPSGNGLSSAPANGLSASPANGPGGTPANGNGRSAGHAPDDPLVLTGRHAIAAPPRAETGAAEPAARANGIDPGGPPPGRTENGLPVRVRQQSLAPQLRDSVLAPAESGSESPSPEATRSAMSAFWEGRTRALADADPAPGQVPELPTDTEGR